MSNEQNGNSSDSEGQGNEWDPEEDLSLAEQSIAEVLQAGESEFDKSQPYGKISVRLAPLGLFQVLTVFGRSVEKSLSEVERLAMKHGLAIIQSESTVRQLQVQLQEFRRSVIIQGSRPGLRLLETKIGFHFANGIERQTTLSTIWWVSSALSELARELGLPIGQLALLCCLYSVNSAEDIAAYQRIIGEDLAEFEAFVRRRYAMLIAG